MAGNLAQVGKHLPSKHEDTNLSAAKNKKNQSKK
jgi:hypothetical protein